MRMFTPWLWFFLFWAIVVPLRAADFIGPRQAVGGTVGLPSGKYLKNVYVSGPAVSVEKTVHGNLYAAGRDIKIKSAVGNNSHLVGQSLWVDGSLAGDLIAISEDLNLSPRSAVSGDLMALCKDARLEGAVKGGVWLVGDQVVLNAPVEGESMIRYDHSLVLGPKCRIKGRMTCYGPHPPTIEQGAVATDIDYRNKESIAVGFSRLSRWMDVFGWVALLRLAAWLLAAWLLWKFFPRSLSEWVGDAPTKFLPDFALGFCVVAAALVVIPFLFLILVGWYVSLTICAFFITSLLLARLLAFFYLAALLSRFLDGERKELPPFRWVAAGIFALHFFGGIPWLGIILSLGLSFAALGAMTRLVLKGSPIATR